jgi:uncharacterized protein (TIGR02001 family)
LTHGSFRLVAGVALCAAAPAAAEISAALKLQSDDRFRGRSLSGGQPVVKADVVLDSGRGAYIGGSGTATLSGERRRGFSGANAYAGYATRLETGVSFDVGASGYLHTRRYSGDRRDSYGELYAGVTGRRISAYVHYTPDYFGRSVPVVYISLGAFRAVGDDYAVKAHAGLLAQTSGPARLGGRRFRYDTALSLSRPLGGFEAEVAVAFAGPNDAYFGGPWGARSAVTVALSRHF